MIKILKNFKIKEWLQIAVCLVFVTVQVWLDLKLPDYMSEITTLIQTEGSAVFVLVVMVTAIIIFVVPKFKIVQRQTD